MNTTPDSLIAALTKAGIKAANHAFITHFTSGIGISSYRAVDAAEPYIEAARRDGSGTLRIFSGYSIGFTEEEAKRYGQRADEVRLNKNGTSWLVSHPEHGHLGPRAAARKQPPTKRCPNSCGYELSRNNLCPQCD